MNGYKYILFDLDGTLTDPKEGITRSVAYALEKMGIEAPELDELCKFIGPPLKDSFMHFYGMSETDAQTAVSKYREHFSQGGLFQNVVYEGMPELLKSLKSQGKTLIVATSKPQAFAKQILDHFGLSQYFEFVSGSEFDGTRVKKAEVIEHALRECRIDDRSSAVMVGDRSYDVIGAKENGLACIGVLYGYGSREELQEAGADHIVETISELKDLLI